VFSPPADPVVVNDTINTPGTAVLSATGSGSLSWWDAPSGGTQMGLGASFTTPFINTTTTYYVEDEVTHAGLQFNLGPVNNTAVGGGSSSNVNQALIFDCLNPFILHTVDVYATNPGTRTIILEDASGTTLQSAVVNVVAGLNTIVLDFSIVPGTGYQLTRTGGELFRNNPGTPVGFPFTIDNFCSITGTTAGANLYYSFYNWDIRLPDNSCVSARVPVSAVIESPNTIAEVAEIRALKVYPNPAGNLVNVSFEHNGNSTLKVELIDAVGNLVATKAMTPSTSSNLETSFDISTYARGVYSVHIISDNKNYYHKLIIQ